MCDNDAAASIRPEAGRHNEAENLLVGLHFVPHPRAYIDFWSSNYAVASWLRELGCETAVHRFMLAGVDDPVR